MVAACGGSEGEQRPPTQTVAPTAAATNTPSGAQPTRAPTQPTGGQGDAKKGQELFTRLACSGCHAITDAKIVGPGMAGLKDRAGTRVAGMSADAYLEQSIKEPNAFVVPEYLPNLMPATFGSLTADEISNLIAYLKTL
jgi:cytochrome c2